MPERTSVIQTENLQIFEKAIRKSLDKISRRNIIARIWSKDWTVWKKDKREISNRLGWLLSPQEMTKNQPQIEKFIQTIREEGYTHALLLGMGGSSLAPEVLSTVFKTQEGYLDLHILDSTDPAAILSIKNKLNPQRTLFIVSSKSGTTVETLSLFNFFFNWVSESGSHFIAITDPGTPLEDIARNLCFRACYLGDPEIGGRFSALSPFGLVPSALKGIEIQKILDKGQEMAALCQISSPLQNNPGAFLGAILGVLAEASRDKATFILSPKIESFGFWLEQLIAESTGKEGKAILPVVGEPLTRLDAYGDDRFFVYLRLEEDKTYEPAINALKGAQWPLITLTLSDIYELGSQFFLWEMATAISCFLLGINPFDQPNVEASKKKTLEILKIYKEKGMLYPEKPAFKEKEISLYSEIAATSMKRGFELFLAQARPGDYVAIQAFLQPCSEIVEALQSLRVRLRDKTKLAVTVGFGPRFLHSTGQLHKGDKGNGLFIQLVAADLLDLPIPDQPGSPHSTLSFRVLKEAQARGDRETLKERGRRVIRFHLGENVREGLKKIISFI